MKKPSDKKNRSFSATAARPPMTLSERFVDAVKFLKKTYINTAQGKVKLDVLPWHIVIGRRGSGKTSFLTHSEVPYVLAKKAKHIAPSRHCDWWVTNKVVLLDVPGSYMTRKGQLLWLELLALLEQACSDDTVRSIMLMVDLKEIERPNKENITLLRRRILSLQKKLNTSIPLYITINHTDNVPGFTEFFANVTQDERKHTWGFLLNFLSDGKNNFKKRFATFINHLNDQLVWRLQHEGDLDTRIALTEFPGHMSQVEKPLFDFILTLCGKAGGKIDIDIKGIFFVSSAEDLPTTALSQTNEGNVSVEKTKRLGYFIHDIISNFLPHHPLMNKPYKQNVFTSGAFISAAAVVFIMTSLWSFDYYKHIRKMHHVETTISEYKVFAGKKENPSLDQVILTLSSLIKTWESLQHDNLTLPFSKHIFYDDSVEKTLMAGIDQTVNENFFPILNSMFESKMRSEIQQKQYQALYSTLRAYLMLDNPSKVNTVFLTNTIKPYFANPVPDNIVRSVLTVLLKQTAHDPKTNKTLVKKARTILSSLHPAQLGFIVLENKADENTINPIVNLTELSWLSLDPSRNQMPMFYTDKGRKQALSQDLTEIVETSLKHNWILGDTYGKINDRILFSSKLKNLYLSAYSNQWGLLVSQIKPMKPRNLKEAQLLMEEANNSLMSLLVPLRINTQFEGLEKINPQLMKINSLLTDEDKPTRALLEVMHAINYLSEALIELNNARDTKKAVFQFSQPIMDKFDKLNKSVVLIDTAELPEPIKTWVAGLSKETWALLVNASIAYITDIETQEAQRAERAAAHRIPSILEEFTQKESTPVISAPPETTIEIIE